MMHRMLLSLIAAAFAMAAPPVQAQDYSPDVLELDGSNALQLIPHPALSIPDTGTVEFWVSPEWTKDPGYDPVILSSIAPEGTNFLIAVLRGRDGIGILAGEKERLVSADFSDGQMHHVAVSDYGDSIIVYIDGTTAGEFTGVSFASHDASEIWIGTSDGKNDRFAGAVAAMRFWQFPIEQDDLVTYSRTDYLTEEPVQHPALQHLSAVSDFNEREMLVIE